MKTAPTFDAALRTLAAQLDRRPARPTVRQVVERGYAAGVADRVNRGPFTGTDRAALLRAGVQLGIPHGRANLIIALRQQPPPVGPKASWVSALVPALVVQSTLIVTAVLAWLV